MKPPSPLPPAFSGMHLALQLQFVIPNGWAFKGLNRIRRGPAAGIGAKKGLKISTHLLPLGSQGAATELGEPGSPLKEWLFKNSRTFNSDQKQKKCPSSKVLLTFSFFHYYFFSRFLRGLVYKSRPVLLGSRNQVPPHPRSPPGRARGGGAEGTPGVFSRGRVGTRGC